MLSQSQIEELAYKAKYQRLSQQEKIVLDLWYDSYDDNRLDAQNGQKKIKKKLWANIVETTGIQRKNRLWPRFIAAACITFIFGLALYFYVGESKYEVAFTEGMKEIPAGGDKAWLILEDGSSIDLSKKNAYEQLIKQIPAVINLDNGEVAYKSDEKQNFNKSSIYNTILTPSGGQYKLILADGSKIWLNSKSSIKFPVSFSGSSERVVELTGEGYFEISKDSAHPFIVRSKNQYVKVLGTHFNLNTYENETAVRTTLLEGSVQISNPSSTITLNPGEQAINSGTTIQKQKNKGTKDVSWKDGYFEFHNDDLPAVMRQIERWYGVNVVYTGEIPKKRFTGKIYRNLPLSGALKVITYFEVNFKVSDKTIYID